MNSWRSKAVKTPENLTLQIRSSPRFNCQKRINNQSRTLPQTSNPETSSIDTPFQQINSQSDKHYQQHAQNALNANYRQKSKQTSAIAATNHQGFMNISCKHESNNWLNDRSLSPMPQTKPSQPHEWLAGPASEILVTSDMPPKLAHSKTDLTKGSNPHNPVQQM